MKKNSQISRRTRAGTYTVLLSLFLLALLVVCNLLVLVIPDRFTVIDTSATGLYTLSSVSTHALRDIDLPVTVYLLCEGGVPNTEGTQILTFLKRYTSLNSSITVKTVDPIATPSFVSAYTDQTLDNYSVIVESARRAKVIPYGELYLAYNEFLGQMTFNEYYDYLKNPYYSAYLSMSETSFYFNGESRITNSILYTLSTDVPKIYALSNHGENALEDGLIRELEANSFAVIRDFSILSAGGVPEDCALLLINAPESDLSADEVKWIGSYLAGGGKLLLTTRAIGVTYATYTKTTTDENGVKAEESVPATFPRLLSLLSTYGLSAQNGIIVESDQNRYYSNMPYALLPEISEDHPITIGFDSTYLLALTAHPITIENSSSAVSIFSSTRGSYTVSGNGTGYDREETSISGPFTIGAAYSDDTSSTRLVWISSESLLLDQVDDLVSGGNFTYALSMCNWLCDKEGLIAVPSISLEEPMLTVTNTSLTFLGILLAVVLPLSVILGGLIYWIRRRRR